MLYNLPSGDSMWFVVRLLNHMLSFIRSHCWWKSVVQLNGIEWLHKNVITNKFLFLSHRVKRVWSFKFRSLNNWTHVLVPPRWFKSRRSIKACQIILIVVVWGLCYHFPWTLNRIRNCKIVRDVMNRSERSWIFLFSLRWSSGKLVIGCSMQLLSCRSTSFIRIWRKRLVWKKQWIKQPVFYWPRCQYQMEPTIHLI